MEPLGAVEPAVEAVTATGAMPEIGVTASATMGGTSAATVTVAVLLLVSPMLSVTLAVIV